tara:strand:+ start:3547 stop:3750 length:204 start_codon:yes stop_codon:yes gene_type:complete
MREEIRHPDNRDHITEDDTWTKIETPEEAGHAVRFLLMIKSRRELNQPEEARRWEVLAGRFEMWKRE